MAVKFSLNLNKKTDDKGVVALDEGIKLDGKNDEAIILIHGLTGAPNEMRFLANFLNREGFTVICPRLANHGAPIHILKKTTWEDCYQSVKDCYLQLKGKYKRVYAGGLSMGALLALLLADEFKDEISGISCLSPTLFYDGWNTPWYSFLLPLGYLTPLKHFCYYKEEPPYGVKNEAIQRRIHEFYSKAKLDNMQGVEQFGYPYFPITLLYQLNRLVGHLSKRLGDIHVPVQLIQAEQDDMTSIRNSQFIYDRVRSAQKELVLLHNSYHIVTADQERHTVALKMAAFFSAR